MDDKIKTLKDGTKIIKQEKYEAWDNILIKNKFHSGIQLVDMDFMPGNVFNVLQVKPDRETNNGIEHCYRVDVGDGFSWCVCQSDIKGKVIE